MKHKYAQLVDGHDQMLDL